jgi:hypothetical protein
MFNKLLAAAAAVSALTFATPPAFAEPGKVIVSLYRAAPGQQVALLEWLAKQDQVSQAAGLGATQIYVHTSGDSWDFMVINPQTSAAQDDALDAAAKKLGAVSGPKASIEFRKMIGSHTDTYANGPMSAAQILAEIGK